MPIYEYRCNNCGELQEVLHKSRKNIESIKCSNCGDEDVTRLFSTVNVSVGRMESNELLCCGREEKCSAPRCAVRDICRQN